MQVSRKFFGIAVVLALALALVGQVALASPVSPSKGSARVILAQTTATETTAADTETPAAVTETPAAMTDTPAATEAATETAPAETATLEATAAATVAETATPTAPTTLPVAGGDSSTNWLIPLLLVGGVLLLLGAYVRRSAR